MTAALKTFAKVRTLHDSTTNPGEKASAAARMTALASKAGTTVAEAVSKLDTPQPKIPAQAMAESFNAFFNTPEMRAERAERETRRRIEAATIVQRYGSEDAVFADTPIEAALRAACEPLLGLGETWETGYSLAGWGSLGSRHQMPASLRDAVSRAWPMPETVATAWIEYEATDRLTHERYVVDDYYEPHLFSEAR
ncbi:hypothetical protein ABIE45_000977 [Methylobacterium sp. OAE515]|uniref:hypothetical protein n=1 Tax=Methylobacterium sp. OAE515 TaxID=2817895 RepID=UPI0017895D7E